MASIVYRQMPSPLGAAPTNPCTSAIDWMQKRPGWGQIFGANPWVLGGMVMDEIDTCIYNAEHSMQAQHDTNYSILIISNTVIHQ